MQTAVFGVKGEIRIELFDGREPQEFRESSAGNQGGGGGTAEGQARRSSGTIGDELRRETVEKGVQVSLREEPAASSSHRGSQSSVVTADKAPEEDPHLRQKYEQIIVNYRKLQDQNRLLEKRVRALQK